MTTRNGNSESVNSETVGSNPASIRAIEWSVLVEWFGGLGQKYLTAEQWRAFAGMELRPVLATGWLTPIMGEPDRFVPCAELKAEIESLLSPVVTAASLSPLTPALSPLRGEGEEKEPAEVSPPLHVSMSPFPHLVPTPTETVPAREIESEASQGSNGAAGAEAASTLLEPQRRGDAEKRGRWDANPVQPVEAGLSPVATELAAMIGALKAVSDEVQIAWLNIAQTQDLNGWKQFNEISQGTAHLRRLGSDLFNKLAECEYRLELARNTHHARA